MSSQVWCAGFVLTTVEAIGDITATEEASALATFGDKHNKRVQGGLLGDGQHLYQLHIAIATTNHACGHRHCCHHSPMTTDLDAIARLWMC